MSEFQNHNRKYLLLENLLRLYVETFYSNPKNEVTQRVNPTGRIKNLQGETDQETKLLRFEEITLRRTQKFLLQEINSLIDEIHKDKNHSPYPK